MTIAIEADGTSEDFRILPTAESIATFCSGVKDLATLGPVRSRMRLNMTARTVNAPRSTVLGVKPIVMRALLMSAARIEPRFRATGKPRIVRR